MALLYNPEALDGVPISDRKRCTAKIEWLWENRASLEHTLLRRDLNPFFKWRFGEYRIIYTYDHEADELIIHLVADRSAVYDLASRLQP